MWRLHLFVELVLTSLGGARDEATQGWDLEKQHRVSLASEIHFCLSV